MKTGAAEKKIRTSTYKSGEYFDSALFPVFRKQGARRKKFRPTSEVQERLNGYNSRMKLVRLLHANFTEGDTELHLTYNDKAMPQSEKEAKRDVQNFLRRVRRIYKKLSIELKYIWVTEKGAKSERVHHHITLSKGADRNELEDIWEKGYANSKRLRFNGDGLKGLAHYITKQKLYFRRWNCSKNLNKPDCSQRHNAVSNRTMKDIFDDFSEMGESLTIEKYSKLFEKLYPGYEVTSLEAEKNNVNQGYYIKIFGRRKKTLFRRRELICDEKRR